MSTWTAVIGVIEMDDIFPLLTNNSLDDQISDIEKVLGPQWTFYNTKDYESIKSGLGFVDGAIDVYTKRMTNPVPNFIDPKNYLFSIPTNQIGLNPNLKQNPGWD